MQTHVERIDVAEVFLLVRRIADGVGVFAIAMLHSEGHGVKLALHTIHLVFYVGVTRLVLEGFTGHTQPAFF